jgi:hypothetical protein
LLGESGQGVVVVVDIDTLEGEEESLAHFSPSINAKTVAAVSAAVAIAPMINDPIACVVQSVYSMG